MADDKHRLPLKLYSSKPKNFKEVRKARKAEGLPSVVEEVTKAVPKSAQLERAASNAESFLNRVQGNLWKSRKPLGLLLFGNLALGGYLLTRPKPTPSGETHEPPSEDGPIGPTGTSLVGSGGTSLTTPGGTPLPIHSTPHLHHAPAPASHESHHEEGPVGPTGTSLVGSGGTSLSTPGGTPLPLHSTPRFHHGRPTASHEGHHEDGPVGPTGTSLVGSGGTSLSTPGGTPLPIHSTPHLHVREAADVGGRHEAVIHARKANGDSESAGLHRDSKMDRAHDAAPRAEQRSPSSSAATGTSQSGLFVGRNESTAEVDALTGESGAQGRDDRVGDFVASSPKAYHLEPMSARGERAELLARLKHLREVRSRTLAEADQVDKEKKHIKELLKELDQHNPSSAKAWWKKLLVSG